MSIGDRIKAPSGLFKDEFLEMRYMGSYQDALLPAIVFRLMELACEQVTTQPLGAPEAQCLYRLVGDGTVTEQIVVGIKAMNTAEIKKEAVYQSIATISAYLQAQYQLQPLVSQSFEPLCLQGQFCLNYCNFGDKINRQCANVEVALAHHQGSLFLLYPNCTFSSFVDLKCLHIALKYDLYRKMQEICGSWAVSQEDMGNMEVKSDCCKEDIREIVINCCFDREMTVEQPKGDRDCQLCGKMVDSKKGKWCSRCEICSICIGKNYFTANFAFTPCCHTPVTPALQLNIRKMLISTQPLMQETMKRLKHDKEMSWSERFQDDIGEHRPGTAALPGRGAYQPILQKQTVVRGNYDAGNEAKSTKSTVKPAYKRVEGPKGIEQITYVLQRNGQILNRKDKEAAPNAEEMKIEPGAGGDEMVVDLTHPDNEVPPAPLPTAPQPMEHREEVKWAVCRVCESAFTSEDGPYQCPRACRCRYCIIESIAAKKVTYCKMCDCYFSPESRRLFNGRFKRCHICNIVVISEDIEQASGCNNVCKRCVLFKVRPGVKISNRTKVFCSCSPDKTFNINPAEYNALAETPIGACCERATEADPKLPCGHPVCKIHAANLKSCRSCQRPRFT